MLIPELTPAMCCAASDISLTGLPEIDGYQTQLGDRVLCTAQTNEAQNGPWMILSTGVWARPSDFPTNAIVQGRTCAVMFGSTFAGTQWLMTAPAAGLQIDTSEQTWIEAIGGISSLTVDSTELTGALTLESPEGTMNFTVSGETIEADVNAVTQAVTVPLAAPPATGEGQNGDYALVFDGDEATWYGPKASGAWPAAGGTIGGTSSSFAAGIFGDGSDGAVTFDGLSTYSFATLAGSTYSLKLDVFATDIIVDSGVTVVTQGQILFCTGTLTNNGTIHDNGTAASGSTAGTGSPVGAVPTLFGGQPGAAGGTGNGPDGPSWGARFGIGSSGAGGAGSSTTGGNGGGPNQTDVSIFRAPSRILSPYYDTSPISLTYTNPYPFTGGCGGGAGGGDGTNSGGGGGSGGGILVIYAQSLANAGTIEALGGAGGTPSAGNCGGGGGGGGGLVLTYTQTAVTGSGTISATGGAAGEAVGSGSAGGDGGDGTVLNVVLV